MFTSKSDHSVEPQVDNHSLYSTGYLGGMRRKRRGVLTRGGMVGGVAGRETHPPRAVTDSIGYQAMQLATVRIPDRALEHT